MMYIDEYSSPLGKISLSADDIGLNGVWFNKQKYFAKCLDKDYINKETPILKDTKKWLDIYFSSKEPDFTPPLSLIGTDFQKKIWSILSEIPYGKTTTYGEISNIFKTRYDRKSMSAQAVGGAVGRNNISIIIPCHRVIGSDGSLTGYAGGIYKKIELLRLEKANFSLK